ncbi:hypothetical protein ACFOYW_04555 [Gryllotalpicola reticulitermitis]|uniref:Uncharacterized protein n=1 Tax=Gryllotalpicola reticulitermitis TaxID=1184153 RepID=A0ABV8Q2K6_9MICO
MTDDDLAEQRVQIERLHPGRGLPELTADELRIILMAARHDARKGRPLTRIVIEPYDDQYLGRVGRSVRFEREDRNRG